MGVYQAVQDGEYKNSLPYPERVKEPAVLRKSARDLTDDEVASLAAVKAQYVADVEAHERAKYAYRQEEGRLFAKFRADLEAEYGLVGHPKADALFNRAWEQGHSAGFGEVATIYDDLVELVR